MADEKSKLTKVGAGAPVHYDVVVNQGIPDRISDRVLLITVVLAIGAYLLIGFPGLISSVLLVVAYLKRSKGDYEKAILYNKMSRIVSIIMISIGVFLIVIVFGSLILYYAVALPILLSDN